MGSFKSLPGSLIPFHRWCADSCAPLVISLTTNGGFPMRKHERTGKEPPGDLPAGLKPATFSLRQDSQDSIVPGINDIQVFVLPAHAVRAFQRNLSIAESPPQHC